MELTEGSETSANHDMTPGKYPKEHIQYSKHGESLKSRIACFFIFLLRWFLHVSAKQCHPQGATMFLSEPLQRQYGRRQVIGHTYDGTYITACYITPTCFGKTMPSSGSDYVPF